MPHFIMQKQNRANHVFRNVPAVKFFWEKDMLQKHFRPTFPLKIKFFPGLVYKIFEDFKIQIIKYLQRRETNSTVIIKL